MMVVGSTGQRTTSGSSGAAALELIAPPTGGLYIREIMISLAAATASTYGLGRPAAKGITPTSPVPLQLEYGSDKPMLSTTALAWGTGPTVPANFLRRVTLPAVIGSWIRWRWHSEPLVVQAGMTLVLWNLAANGVVDVSITAVENY